MLGHVTLWQRIADELRAQIESGALRPGDKLPSTRQLMAHYECSETVIRFVMIQLKAEDLVEGRQGIGVFVLAKPLSGG